MAGYNYMNGGYYTNDPNKGTYEGIECSDHVCRPVIVDAEGRKRPIIAYTPSSIPESYIATRAERVVEHVHAPVVVTEYQYISQEKVDTMKDYGVAADKWRRPSGPVRDRSQVVVTEYGYGSPITEVEPVKKYGVTGDKWFRPSSTVRDQPQVGVTEYGYGSPTKVEPMKDSRVTRRDRPQVVDTEYGYGSPTNMEPVKDSRVTGLYRPPEVEEFITKVQTEASRPTRPGTNWRNRPNSTGQGGNPSYGEYADYNNSDNWNKPNGNTIREPTITSKEGWERPNRDTPLSGPTNDIGKAVEILKDAVKSSSPVTAAASPQPLYTAPASTLPKRDTYTEVIDSREAARRYGNFNLASRPFQTGETAYTGTIDSREAARKYKGSPV